MASIYEAGSYLKAKLTVLALKSTVTNLSLLILIILKQTLLYSHSYLQGKRRKGKNRQRELHEETCRFMIKNLLNFVKH